MLDLFVLVAIPKQVDLFVIVAISLRVDLFVIGLLAKWNPCARSVCARSDT